MARRADHTREELTELAISAGIELIEKEGFSKFSARKVATNIGYSIGTLYNVFGSYDDFILHIHARTLDGWYEAMQSALERDKSGQPIRALARAYVAFCREHYALWLALFEHHMSEERPLPEWYVPKMARFFTLVENILLPDMHNNRAKAKRAARVLWAGIHGICILALSGKLDLVGADSAEILAMSLVDNYMAGMTRPA
jgi:AcrR family transcriptional regulator